MDAREMDIVGTGVWGKLMTDYIEGNPILRPFYRYTPDFTSFGLIMDERSKIPVDRVLLANELSNQHKSYFDRFPILETQIARLRDENCFTITTGHQLCLATGPLFFIYKIITTINTCKKLQADFPDKHFVPVYWMASEDHDIDEINHFYPGGQLLSANVEWKGPAGRQSCSGLSTLWLDLKELLKGKPYEDAVFDLLNNCYDERRNLAEATRRIVLELFASEGLLVIDADSRSFKKAFVSIMRDELLLQNSASVVSETSKELGKHYKTQVVPREINLFYMDDSTRERIVADADGNFVVLNTDLVFTREFLIDLLEKQPERFSPNVVLRPLYQELLLPNLGVVLGPGETAYWLQLQQLFEQHGIHFPMLIPRNAAVVLAKKSLEKFYRIGFSGDDLLHSFEQLSARWIAENEHFDDSLKSKSDLLVKTFDDIVQLLGSIDPTLESSVRAEQQKMVNGIGQLSKKGNSALKRKHETVIAQIRSITEIVRPQGEPQERILNFLSFYATSGPDFIRKLMEELTPLSFQFNIVVVE